MSRIVSGACTYSKAHDRYPANAPRYAVKEYDCYVVGDDGRTYVDTVAALGAVALGYGWPEVDGAARMQLLKGVSFSLPTRLEEELAERICGLIPGAGDWLVRFAKNGNDAVNAAVRIARAKTGREGVLYNGYHGHADWCMVEQPKTGGIIPRVRACSTRLLQGSLEHLDWQLRASGPPGEVVPIAAVVLEPIVSADPRIPVAGYFRAVRELCDQFGALLVIDEMVTGLRAGFLGAVNTYGIEPDLVCYGKAIANGWPLSVLAGKPELMHRIEQDVFYSTTFGGEAVSLAAALATLDVFERDGATARIQELAQEIGTEFGAITKRWGLAVEVLSLAGRVTLKWRDPEQGKRWAGAMVAREVLTQGYVNVMVAHEGRGAELIMDAAAEAFEVVREPKRVAA